MTTNSTSCPISRDDMDSLLEYTERYASLNGEPHDGDCREVISRGNAWLETGSASIDLKALQDDLINYTVSFAQLNHEPVDGDCWRLIDKVRPSAVPAEISAKAAGSAPSPAKRSMNPDVHDALLFALWHHQGGSSRVGQPLRQVLGMGVHDRLTEQQLVGARRVQTGLSSPSTLQAINDIDKAFERLNSMLDAAGSLEGEARRSVCELRLAIARGQGDSERIRVAEEMLQELDRGERKAVRFVIPANEEAGGYATFSLDAAGVKSLTRSMREEITVDHNAVLEELELSSEQFPVAWGADITDRAAAGSVMRVYPGGWCSFRSSAPRCFQSTAFRGSEVVSRFGEAHHGEIVFLRNDQELRDRYTADHDSDAGECEANEAVERPRG